MRSSLFASTALLVVALPAAAQTVIDKPRTDPARTSTIKAGGPDAIRITSTGSVKVAGGTAVTIDSNHPVTNAGAIEISNADGATGIGAVSGASGSITNTGSITIDETYTPVDGDKDGDLDGPLAVGSGRAGIRTLGAFSGTITHGAAGVITVEGNTSAGIALGGTLAGNLVHDGKTTVTGDRSVGVRTADVTGNVRIGGTIAATGQDAIGVRIGGNVGGALVVQGAVGATGFRSTGAPADPAKLDADDRLIGGPALLVEGNVAGGVLLAVAPKDSDPNNADEDKDGIDDAKEGSAAVSSFGSAPAMIVGATDRAITIGAVAGTGSGFGIVIDGAITGNGALSGVEANGLQVGGRGGAVAVTGGIGVTGKVEAIASGARATALRLGAGASTPEIRNAGAITATVTGTGPSAATALQIEAGASVPTIRNSGTVKASVTDAAGSAIALIDRSGSVALVENSGAITASGAGTDRNVAIDLAANATGATVRQTAVAAGVTAPSIAGDIRFGSGNDVLEVADGTVTGNTGFGAGANRLTLSGDARYTGNVTFGGDADAVSLAGTSVFTGVADFGGGADTLAIAGGARFSGSFLNSGGLALTVSEGTLDIARSSTIGTLAVGAKGVVSVVLDKAVTGPALTVSGGAGFTKGAVLSLRLASIANAEGRYTVLSAGSLTGAADLTTSSTLLPFLYKGVLSTPTANELAVDLTRKTATELGLNRSQGAAYNAIYAALGTDDKVGAAIGAITDGDSFRDAVSRLLPDHAGGTFEAVTLGSRSMARVLQDPHGPFKDEGNWGYWLTTSAWGTNKSTGDTADYQAGGWGAASGVERAIGFGNVGVSAAYLHSENDQDANDNEVLGDQYEFAAYWRGRWGGLQASARAAWATIDFASQRRFAGMAGTEQVERLAKGSWNGKLTSLAASVSQEIGGGSFFVRPNASVDFYRLSEDGYTETGGGKAIDLIVDDRTSDEIAVTGNIVAGVDFMGMAARDENWFRVELEGGRREIVGGELGTTTARFGTGPAFTLEPDERESGWTGRVRAVGGNGYFRFGGDFGAEQRESSRWALSLRASLQVGL